ncbi:hypothetical protein ACTG9Q_29220 [Actinokineospora sp. 24-640]
MAVGFVLQVAYRDDVPVRTLRTAADIDEFVAELLDAGWEYTSASVYALPEGSDAKPDHQMIIGADRASGLGAVRYSGGSAIPGEDATEWFSVGDRANPDVSSSPTSGPATIFRATPRCPSTWSRPRWSN